MRSVRRPASPLLLAGVVFVVIATLERWALGLPYTTYFVDLLSLHGPLGIALRLGVVLVVAGLQLLFYWASFTSSRPWRLVYLAVFSVATFAQFGYVRATGAVMNAIDLTVAFASLRFWGAMAGQSVDWLAAFPVAAFAAVLAWAPSGTAGVRRLAVVAGVTLAVHSAHTGLGYLRDADGLAPYPAHVVGTTQALARTATVFAWNGLATAATRRPRHELAWASDTTPSSHVVLVIDESIRADRLSVVGYERPTTPWLEALEREGRLTNWGVAASAALLSQPAVASLLIGVRLPDRDRRTETSPTIFQYAKAMNYRTHLFDGQTDAPPFGMAWRDLRYIDDFRTPREFGERENRDFRMAAAVRDVLREPDGQFVVVLKRGNHFPYYDNFAAGANVWSAAASNSEQEQLREDAPDEGRWIDWRVWGDLYDDGLRYNIDRFFQGVLGDDGSLPRTVLLYTSDHGQPYHPRTPADFRAAAGVPLLMFGDDRPVVDTGYAAGHHNLFPTLLDLMGYPPEHRPVPYGRSLLSARQSDRDVREVFEGDPFGLDVFKVTDFDALEDH